MYSALQKCLLGIQTLVDQKTKCDYGTTRLLPCNFFGNKTLHKRSRILKQRIGQLGCHRCLSGRDNRRHCCCCVAAACCCGRGLLLIVLLLLEDAARHDFNVNSNPDFRFCLTGIQILSLRFSKCRFVYDLNRYF